MRLSALILLPWLVMTASCGASPPNGVQAVEIPAAGAEPAETAIDEERAPSRPAKAVKRPPPAPAVDSANLADPEAAFSEGRRLMNEGKIAEACARFEDSLRLDPALGTMLNLALCQEKLGDTARACDLLRDVITAAQQAGQSSRAVYAQSKRASLSCPP